MAVEKYAPSKKWYIDTIVKVLTLAGNFVSQDIISATALFVAETPLLQSYAIYKTFYSARENLK